MIEAEKGIIHSLDVQVFPFEAQAIALIDGLKSYSADEGHVKVVLEVIAFFNPNVSHGQLFTQLDSMKNMIRFFLRPALGNTKLIAKARARKSKARPALGVPQSLAEAALEDEGRKQDWTVKVEEVKTLTCAPSQPGWYPFDKVVVE